MNLEQPSRENLDYLIREIKGRLKMVNASIIDPEDFRLDDYEEILDLYRMIEKKQGHLTMLELEGILQELGDLRKNGR